MPFFKRKYLWVAVLSIVFLIPNFFPFHLIAFSTAGHNWEEYDSSLTKRFTSVESIVTYVDSIANETHVNKSSVQYGNIYAKLIRKRFYHGYSHYSLRENWIAALAGRFIWDDLSAIVIPDDILQYSSAACSQQSIVMMACFKEARIPFRKVGFEHHYALEGYFDSQWYFFDTNMEPDFSTYKRESIDTLKQDGLLYKAYGNSMNNSTAKSILSHYYKELPNLDPAPNASLFHKITKFLSCFAWIFPFLFLLIKPNKGRQYFISKNIHSEVPEELYENSLPVL